MKRIIRLTESDLTRIVRRVIMEQTPKVKPPNISRAITLDNGEAKRFTSTLENINSVLLSLFDKTYFSPVDKDDVIKTDFLNDIKNFKNIITVIGGGTPTTNIVKLKSRLSKNDSKRQTGISGNDIRFINDLNRLISYYSPLKMGTVNDKLKQINDSLRDILKDAQNVDNKTQKYDAAASNRIFNSKLKTQRELGNSINKLNSIGDQVRQNPFNQKWDSSIGN